MEEEQKKRKKGEIAFRENLNLIWKVSKPYSWLIIAVILVVSVIAFVRIVEKFIFKELIDKGTAFAAGTILQDKFIQILLILILVYVLSQIIKVVGFWLQLHIMNRLESNLMFDIKRKFFNHIVGLSHKFHTTHKTGSLISRMGRGSRAIEGVVDFFIFNGVPLVLQVILVGGSIYYFDKISALIVIVTTVVFITYSMLIINRNQDPRLKAIAAEDREKGAISDFFMNIDSIKYFGKENRVKNMFFKLIDDTRGKLVKTWDYYKWLESGQSLIINVGLFFLVYFPMMKFLNGEITIGTIVFIYTVYGNVAEPLFGFVWGVRRLYDSLADFQDLFAYDKIKNEIEDKEGAKRLKIKQGSIEFKDVDFSYHKRKIINGLDLKIKPNEKIALVGHSGSGKTTIIKILYRLYDVTSGDVLIDGKSIKDFQQESLRAELSIVPQECMLFDDTVYNNIAFSRPSATREEVMNAIKFAQLDKFINNLEKKEQTIVGERGVKLSGGEKQRVSIARALLANKKILVLDEATSALDSKTEHEIQMDLEKLMVGRTSIIIAHRLSTIMTADRIVVLEKGRIAQIGPHDELINKQGIYRELWSLQKGGYVE